MKAPALEPKQLDVAQRVIAEEEAQRPHLVVALSGARAYGFPSPDSEVDMKAVHVEPTERLLGLLRSAATPTRTEAVDGVEIDYASNEIHPVLIGVLQGNGAYLERILGPSPLLGAADLTSLRPLVAKAMSRRIFRHYLGFATSQRRAWEASGRTSAKKLLYVLRTTLTGAHALRTGQILLDVPALLEACRIGPATELIEAMRVGDKAAIAGDIAERWLGRLDRCFMMLEAAHATSVLPEEPPNADELDAWLLALRRARM